MIYFEDRQSIPERIAVGKGIEPGAEDRRLPHSARNGSVKFVFGKPAAHGHESPQRSRHASLLAIACIAFDGEGAFGAENPHRERVVEHPWRVEELVGGPPRGDTPGRPAGG